MHQHAHQHADGLGYDEQGRNGIIEQQLRAEIEQKSVYQRKAEVAHRTSAVLQDQVLQLQGALNERSADFSRLNVMLGEADAELSKLRVQLAKREQEIRELKASRTRHGSNVLSEQLTALHHGFKDVHKQLLRRDLDDGDTYQTEVTTSTWENLVHELREELDETSLELENFLRHFDKAHSRNLRQEQLEEEIEFYRESARKAAEESSKALSMANEIRAQSVKDGENSLREMHRVQREWDKAQVEVAEFEKALAEEQKKGRLLDLERLNLSRQFAEVGSDLLKKEIQLGESQRAWNTARLERDSMAESLRDAQTQIESLQGIIHKAETRASLSEEMCNEMKILLAEQDKLAQKENEAYEIQRRENEQMQARSEIRRMREAHQVLLANLAAVEKRLNAANEELLVYRRLDVYTLSRAHATALAATHSPPRLTSTKESKRQEIFEKARTLLLTRKKNVLE